MFLGEKMIIELNKIPNTGLLIDEEVFLEKELYKNASILDIKELHVSGNINYDYENNLTLNLETNGKFILQDAITLDPIEYPFSCLIEEKVENLEETCGDFYEKSKNTLDISEILWENIVLEIPISATKASTNILKTAGSGWELTEEKKNEIDPRLAKLAELLDHGKE